MDPLNNQKFCAQTKITGLIVLKFGGAAVSSPEKFSEIASIVAKTYRERTQKLVIVVSAMGDTTDLLIAMAHKVHHNPPPRELAMLLSTGERVSSALLAMALHAQGLPAVSFTGSQAGIVTSELHDNAQILDIRPHRLLPHLEAEKIVIVAGFQGISPQGDITTLGRGGSDTTAVALGCAFGAQKVEFYKDVDGICDKDPRFDPQARCLSYLTYDEALVLVKKTGGKVLQLRCIQKAKEHNLPLHVRPFVNPDLHPGTIIS